MNTRSRSLLAIATLLALGILTLALAGGVLADEPSRATLVLAFGPDDVQTSCITFDEAEITGLDLLQRSGLAVIQAGTTGVGDSICKIDAVGCDFPGEHCFCQCLSTPCDFWSYWYWQDGDWVFSQRGAAQRRVSDGAIEAWVWGDGQTPPPAIDASTCSAPPQLSAPASQDGYPGPEPEPTYNPYPGPGDEEPPEPTPEPEPTEDEILPPTVVPREKTPTPEGEEEPTPEPAPTEEGEPTAEAEASATEAPSPTPTATATATGTPRPTATPEMTATPSPTTGPSATPTDDGMAAAIATAVTRNRATPPAVGGGSSVGSYVAFALLALVLVGLIVYAVLLRRQRARQATE